MITGSLSVPSVGRGHLEISFTEGDAVQEEQARRVIEDMLKRGYSLFIHDETDPKKLIKVRHFDAKHMRYVIAADAGHPTMATADVATRRKSYSKRRGRSRMRSVPVRSSRSIAIAPTAGG